MIDYWPFIRWLEENLLYDDGNWNKRSMFTCNLLRELGYSNDLVGQLEPIMDAMLDDEIVGNRWRDEMRIVEMLTKHWAVKFTGKD